MAFSDQLLTLSNQAKHLEASARAVGQKNEDQIANRKAVLHAAMEAHRQKHGDGMNPAESGRPKSAERHVAWAAGLAGRATEGAEADAVKEIDFVIYSIHEAEYAILDAVDARPKTDAGYPIEDGMWRRS